MTWLFLAPFISIYFIPAIVAMRRHHRNTVVIMALNICLGWTVLGWALSLMWALSNNTRKSHALMVYDLSKPGALASYGGTKLPGD